MSQKFHQIIFLAHLPWERAAKISSALRNKGISTLLVYVVEPPHFNPKDYFDFTIQASSPIEAVAIIHRLNPRIIHLFSLGADDTAYEMIKYKTGRVIYDYKDCFENLVNSKLDHDPDFYKKQRFCIENADGLCCRDLQLKNYCKINKVNWKGKRFLFLDYCWGHYNKPPKPAVRELHTVIAGNFSVERFEPDQADCGYLHITRLLTDRKIHVHIYLFRQYDSNTFEDYQKQRFSEYYEHMGDSEYLHIHTPLTLSKLHEELSSYDYGLYLNQGNIFTDIPSQSILNKHDHYGIASRIYDYIESGLNVLITPNFKTTKRILSLANMATTATASMLATHDLKDTLSDIRNTNLNARIHYGRHMYNINNNIDKLINFYTGL